MVGIAAALGTAWWFRPGDSRRPSAPQQPWVRLSPRAAYEAGVAMIGRGENLASLPYLRHSLTSTRGQLWEVSHAIFTATMNASFATVDRFDTRVPATRSSVERVQLVQEALHYLALAEQAATSPREIARIRKDRAQVQLAWGLGWEAFVSYRDAQASDPTWDEAGLTADTLMWQLEHPTPSDNP